MILPYRYEDVFNNEGFLLGLSSQGQKLIQPMGNNYFTIGIDKKLFKCKNGMYTNTKTISFRESHGSWGKISHLAVFYKYGKMIGLYEADKPRTVFDQTTVCFLPGNFEIFFIE